MSDARPITNITGFVCGSCWNSFSKDDPGVMRGTHVVCPYCGHVLPGDAQEGEDVHSAVRAAPQSILRDSDSYPAMPVAEIDSAPGFPRLEDPGYGWLPPDAGPQAASKAGFVAGDSGTFDDDLGGATLRPDQSHERLMEMVRNAPQRTDASSDAWPAEQADPGFVAGDELPADVDERTPLDIGSRVAEMLAGTESARDDADAAAPDLPLEESPEMTEAELMALRDWKLKAMGLTYNFHGLDALLGWASNKAGQAMSVSNDGTIWKDFGDFFEAVKAGAPVDRAFEQACEPGAAPKRDTASRMARSSSGIKGVHAPDLQVSRPPAVEPAPGPAPAADLGPARNPSGRLTAVSATMPKTSTGSSRRVPATAVAPTPPATAMTPTRIALAVVVFVVAVAIVLSQVLK